MKKGCGVVKDVTLITPLVDVHLLMIGGG